MCGDDCGSAIVPVPFITTLDPTATLGGRNNLSRSLALSKVPCFVPAAVDCDHTTVPISSTATTALKPTFRFILPPQVVSDSCVAEPEIGSNTPLRHTTRLANRIVPPDPNSFLQETAASDPWDLLGISKTEGKRRHVGTKTVLSFRPRGSPGLSCRGKFGGPGRDRTDDLFHAMEARSQLRHRPTRVTGRLLSFNSRLASPPRQTRLSPQRHTKERLTKSLRHTSCPWWFRVFACSSLNRPAANSTRVVNVK